MRTHRDAGGRLPRTRLRKNAAPLLEPLEGRQLLTAAGPFRFAAPAAVPFDGDPNAVALADFNGDGRPDLAASLGGRDVGVALGNGNGTFQPAKNFLANPDPFFADNQAVKVGDFNKDGRPDLVVSTFSGNSVSVLLNSSTGGVLSFEEPRLHGAGAEPVYVAVGDFNRDGKLDVATANIAGDPDSSVGILLGEGDGDFEDVQFVAAGANPNSITVGDFNRDGIADLAVSYSASSGASADKIGVLLGLGDGKFGPVSYFAAGTTPASIAAGDFNRDGILDLAAANFNSNNVTVLIGDGTGAFSPRAAYAVGPQPDSIAAADFNGDGRLDLAVANSGGNSVSVLQGRGNGTFRAGRPRQSFFPAGPNPGPLVVGRIARGFLPDIAVANSQGRASVLLNRSRLTVG